MNHTAFQAEEYDRKIRQTLPYYQDFYEQVTDILKVMGKEDVSWLDIGCGTGKMYEAAKNRVSKREFVFADISERMLELSKSRFQAEGNRFEIMAVQQLKEHGKYDVITEILVNHYLLEEERELAVRNCWQALRVGGVFFTFENIEPNSEIGKRIALQRWAKYQVENGKSQREVEEHIKRYGRKYYPIRVESHLKMMRRCGFHSVELIWMSYMQAGFMGIKG